MGEALSVIFSLVADAIKSAIRNSIPPLKKPKADSKDAIDREIDKNLKDKAGK